MIYYSDRKLKRVLHVMKADIIILNKHWFDVSSSGEIFYVFQMNAIAHV